MKYGIDILTNERIEPSPQSKAKCQCCDSELIPKCGKIRLHHWAHKSITKCDPWWESETEWHRKWKDQFPISWQENIKQDPSTKEKHIADVYNPKLDLVIEFQNSRISSDELQSRELFYKRMIWVLNGNKLKIDISIECESYDFEDKIKRNLKKELRQILSKHYDIVYDKSKEAFELGKRIKSGMTIGDITNKRLLEKINKIIYENQVIIHETSEKLLNKKIKEYRDIINEFERLNMKRPIDEWYDIYNWKYKNPMWGNNQCPVFININEELYLIKNDYILQRVPMNKFLNKYSTD